MYTFYYSLNLQDSVKRRYRGKLFPCRLEYSDSTGTHRVRLKDNCGLFQTIFLSKKKILDIVEYIEHSSPGDWILDLKSNDSIQKNLAKILIKKNNISAKVVSNDMIYNIPKIRLV